MEAFSLVLLLHLILASCTLKDIFGVRVTLLKAFKLFFWSKLLTFQLAVSLLLILVIQNEMHFGVSILQLLMQILVQTQHTIMWWGKKNKCLWPRKSSWQREILSCSASYWNGTEFFFFFLLLGMSLKLKWFSSHLRVLV